MFNKICIIGVGLMGGSIALAARKNQLCSNIVGLGRAEDSENLIHAQNLGIIDHYFFDTALAVEKTDCIIIATPVGATESVFLQLKDIWSDSTVYMDVGSTKVNVIAAAKKVFGYIPNNFVPAHPIAGAEQSGAAAAVSDLFTGKRLIITPGEETSPDALRKVQDFWHGLGTSISEMEVERHDSVLAATSHLPHILAYALVDLLGRKDEQDEIFKFAAGGFKDFTRIASSDPGMWRDICIANKIEIISLIKQLQNELGDISQILETNNSQQLFDTFNNARNARQRFLNFFNETKCLNQ